MIKKIKAPAKILWKLRYKKVRHKVYKSNKAFPVMRIFEKGNWSGKRVCPICKTSKEGKVVLIPIIGTGEGMNYKAEQIHLDCINLWRDEGIIYQVVEGEDEEK